MEYSQANGIFRAGAEYSVRVRDIPCGCRIFRAGAKYSVQPLAVSALPLELFCRAPSIFHIALNLIPIVSGDSKPLRRDWSQQEMQCRAVCASLNNIEVATLDCPQVYCSTKQQTTPKTIVIAHRAIILLSSKPMPFNMTTVSDQ